MDLNESNVPPITPDASYYNKHVESTKKKSSTAGENDDENIQKILEEFAGLDQDAATVHEFIQILSPYVKDNGAVLRKVMEEEIASFEKLILDVFKPIVEDYADILTNEDIQQAKKFVLEESALKEKSVAAISELFRMVPEFDIKEFFNDPHNYLELVLPFPELPGADDVVDAEKQVLFHRVRFMQGERERLTKDNDLIQGELQNIKENLRRDRLKLSKALDDSDRERRILSAKENELLQMLQSINESMEYSVLSKESSKRTDANSSLWEEVEQSRLDSMKPPRLTDESTSDSETSDEENCSCKTSPKQVPGQNLTI